MKIKKVTAKVRKYVQMKKKRNIFRVSATTLLPIFLLASAQMQSVAERNSVKNYVLRYNPSIESQELETLTDVILAESANLKMNELSINEEEINPLFLVLSFITVESQFTKKATSNVGAKGYMQLMKDTANWMNQKHNLNLNTRNLYDTYTNIKLGVIYLNELSAQMTSMEEVAMAYNAGPGAIRRGYRVPVYWKKIRTSYNEISHDF